MRCHHFSLVTQSAVDHCPGTNPVILYIGWPGFFNSVFSWVHGSRPFMGQNLPNHLPQMPGAGSISRLQTLILTQQRLWYRRLARELWCWRRLKSLLHSKEIKPVNPKGNQPWIFIGRTDGWCWSSNILATWCEELTHWKRPWCWERLRAGEGGDRGWDGWMTSPTQWTWIWASSGRHWRTGEPDVLQSMASQRVGHDLATK